MDTLNNKIKLIVITTESIFEDEADALNLLFEKGLMHLHLRKPKASREEQRKLLSRIDTRYHHRIVLHDCYELTNDFQLGGIHLNQRNAMSETKISGTISRSCHSLAEIAMYKDECDYLFLSPIFDSISKSGYQQAFTAEELLRAKNQGVITSKVIALGGITEKNIASLAQFGFGGLALIGSLWGNFEQSKDSVALLNRFKKLLELTKKI